MSTYNGKAYLEKQLETLRAQAVDGHMTVHIRDDGSADNTLEIIEKWKNELDIILYKGDNVGPAKSFWKLFSNEKIRADYYAFCDQDDLWDADKLQRGVEALAPIEGEALWCSNCRIVDKDGVVLAPEMNGEKPDFSIISQFVCGTTQGCAMLFNHKLREYVLGKNVTEIPMHDFVLMTYAIAKGTVVYDARPSFGYRVHANNVVADGGKNPWEHIRSSLKKWFSRAHRNELSRFAGVFLRDNEELLDAETRLYLTRLAKSHRHIGARLWIVFHKKTVSANRDATRSFKLRTVLGLI